MGLTILVSGFGFAQEPGVKSIIKTPELKTDVIGSYPQEVWEYNWTVEFWMVFQTKYITYASFGEPIEIKVVGMGGESKTLFSYDSDQRLTSTLEQEKEGEQWVDNRRDITVYLDNDLVSSHVVENWTGASWQISFGTQYEYTMDGDHPVVTVTKIWDRDSGSWLNSTRTTFTMGTGSVIDETISETWMGGAWVNSSKTRFVFEDDKTILFMSGWLDGAWLESTKMVQEFGENESMTNTMYSGPGDGTWTPAQRFTNNYDSHGNAILTTIEFYTSQWDMLSGTKYLLTYDGNNLTERITQTYSLVEPGNENNTITPGWKNIYKEEFKEFASLSTDPLLRGVQMVQAFPNPAKEEATLSFQNMKNKNLNISILNLAGQLFISDQIYVPIDSYKHTISLDDLSSGTFIILIRDEAGKVVSSSRLIHHN